MSDSDVKKLSAEGPTQHAPMTLEEVSDSATVIQALAQLSRDGHTEIAKAALRAHDRITTRYYNYKTKAIAKGGTPKVSG